MGAIREPETASEAAARLRVPLRWLYGRIATVKLKPVAYKRVRADGVGMGSRQQAGAYDPAEIDAAVAGSRRFRHLMTPPAETKRGRQKQKETKVRTVADNVPDPPQAEPERADPEFPFGGGGLTFTRAELDRIEARRETHTQRATT